MLFGWRTLDVGDQALVYNHAGEARVEIGPKRLFLWRERYVPLLSVIANQNQYLVIRYRSGNVQHQPGPCKVFQSPIEHESVSVELGISLDANEVLVVYDHEKTSGQVKRYIKHGPCLFIPAASEWLHTFCWHGTDPSNKTQMLPKLNTFTKLQVIADQFYYNVDEVRTADDALLRIKLMMFYELCDIERMLDETMDPFADFINCLCADVVAFVAKLSYGEFIEKANQLNDIDNYPQLLERCKLIGYSVSKVVFRGYYASPKLQEMHDNAIKTRTHLKMQYEQEEQDQIIRDKNLKAEKERIILEQNLATEQLKHKQHLERVQLEHKVALDKHEHLVKVEQRKAEEFAKLQRDAENNGVTVEKLKKLASMQVDVNDYMLSQNSQPSKVVQVVTNGTSNFHLHHS